MPVRLTVIATAGFTAATVIALVPIEFPPKSPQPELLTLTADGGAAPAVTRGRSDEPDSDDNAEPDDSSDSEDESDDDPSGGSETGSSGDSGNDSSDDEAAQNSDADDAQDDTGGSATSAPGSGDRTSSDWRSRAAELAAALEESDDPEAAELADRLAELGIRSDGRKSAPVSSGDSGGAAATSGQDSVNASGGAPAQLLDMTNWKLTLPGGEEGDPTEILPPELRSFAQDGVFHLNPEGDGVVFRAEVGGATTKNSNYPRSELREMAGSDEEASWSNTSGSHTLDVRQAITEVPPVKPHVVAAQIHDGKDDVLQIRLEGETLAVQYNDGNDQVVIDPAYQLGTPYDLRIVAADSHVVVFYNGEQAADLPLKGSSWYFKVGAYTQSNPEKGDESGSAGEVVVYDLAIDHGGRSGN